MAKKKEEERSGDYELGAPNVTCIKSRFATITGSSITVKSGAFRLEPC